MIPMLIMFCSVCWSSFYRCHSWLQRVHPISTLAVFLFFLASLVYALSAFSFSHDAPIKVFFQQTVAFGDQEGWQMPFGRFVARDTRQRPPISTKYIKMYLSSHGIVDSRPSPSVRTVLVGVPVYLLNHVVPAFPSSFRNPVECINNPLDLFRLETVLKVFSLGQRRSPSRAKANVLRDATGRAGCERIEALGTGCLSRWTLNGRTTIILFSAAAMILNPPISGENRMRMERVRVGIRTHLVDPW